MIISEIQKQIIKKVEELLGVNIRDVQIPKQGMESEVFFTTDSSGKGYAIKYYSKGSASDAPAYKLLEEHKVDINVPKVLGSFEIEGKSALILEKINFPLLESIAQDQMHRYIPSMIASLKKIHQVKSDKAGFLNESGEKRGWKEIMLAKFNGKDPVLNWSEFAKRGGLDSGLVLKSVANIIKKINETEFIEGTYSFLHTDFSQRNLFVNPDSNEIIGIIDWGEAMFGDPVYDFARIKMLIWHFNLRDKALEDYYKLVAFTLE